MERKNSKERNVYLLIAGLGFLIGFFCVAYYVSTIKVSKEAGINGQLFYLILLLFGVAVSAIIFGVMNSFADMSGETSNVKYKFTGPVVGVMLVVIGGFILPIPPQKNFSVQILDGNSPLSGVIVKLTLEGMDIAPQQTNASGLVTFIEIPEEKFSQSVQLFVTKDGYQNISLDTVIKSKKIKLILIKAKNLVLRGKILTADDNPIPNAEVRVMGTPFTATTKTNGDYMISLKNLYEIGDNIEITITHQAYEDKVMNIDIKSSDTNKDIVLNKVKDE